jgi:hypothetical protein
MIKLGTPPGQPLVIRRGSRRTAGCRVAGRRSAACGSRRCPGRAEAAGRARGQLPGMLVCGWAPERLRQESAGEELLVSREQIGCARRGSSPA